MHSLSSMIKIFSFFFYSSVVRVLLIFFRDEFVFLFYSQLLLKSFILLNFLFQKLFFQVRVSDHVLLGELVYLKVWIVFYHSESSVLLDHCFLFYPFWGLILKLLVHLFLNFASISSRIDFIFKLVIEPQVHQITMHILLQHFCVNQVLTSKFINFLLTYKLILIVDDFLLLLLKLLCYILNVRNPLRGRA